MGGTGVAPVKSGVAPDFVWSQPLPHQARWSSDDDAFPGFGRDARNNRPEACATCITFKPSNMHLKTTLRAGDGSFSVGA
jgi:hypothetical protein